MLPPRDFSNHASQSGRDEVASESVLLLLLRQGVNYL